jgi:hypothetical protein
MERIDIEIIRERVRAGHYLVRSHAVGHALKEGFEREHIVEAILNGRIVEEYPEDQRVLVCGRATIGRNLSLYLHVVCECADPVYVDFVTAYVPDESQWSSPPFRRRRQR